MQTAATAQPAAQSESPPQPAGSDADTVDERAVVDPPLPPDGDLPPAAEAAPAAPSPEPSAASAPPVETQPAAPAPVAEKEIELAADVPQVGSIPATTDVAETRDEPPASEVPSVAAEEPAQAKRKRAARKAVAKAKKKAPARRATAAAQPQPADPFASTGYPVSTTSTANRPAKGFWPLD
jgi:hypothetical protein